MLLGSPTSIAFASVAMLGRGRHSPLSRKSGTGRLRLCASTMSPMGSPSFRAQKHATAFPRLPVGMMNDAGSPVARQIARLVEA